MLPSPKCILMVSGMSLKASYGSELYDFGVLEVSRKTDNNNNNNNNKNKNSNSNFITIINIYNYTFNPFLLTLFKNIYIIYSKWIKAPISSE